MKEYEAIVNQGYEHGAFCSEEIGAYCWFSRCKESAVKQFRKQGGKISVVIPFVDRKDRVLNFLTSRLFGSEVKEIAEYSYPNKGRKFLHVLISNKEILKTHIGPDFLCFAIKYALGLNFETVDPIYGFPPEFYKKFETNWRLIRIYAALLSRFRTDGQEICGIKLDEFRDISSYSGLFALLGSWKDNETNTFKKLDSTINPLYVIEIQSPYDDCKIAEYIHKYSRLNLSTNWHQSDAEYSLWTLHGKQFVKVDRANNIFRRGLDMFYGNYKIKT